jgi:Peptidase A4 family
VKSLIVAAQAEVRAAGGVGHCPWSEYSPEKETALSVSPKRPTSSAATRSPSSDRIRPWLTGNSLKARASRTCARLCVLGCKTIRTTGGDPCLPTNPSHAAFALYESEIRKEALQSPHTWHNRPKVAAPSRSPEPVPRARRLTKAAGVMFAAIVFCFPTMLASASTVPLRTLPTTNWSGYGLAGSGFTGVTGTFNVPAPHRSASCLEDTAIWVGVDGLHNHDLLQAGIAETGFTQTAPPDWPSAGFSGLVCTGRVGVYAWWEDLPSVAERVDLPIHVGDSVTVSIFKMSPGWWALAVHDLTAKQSFLLAQPYAGPQTSVEWVVEASQVVGLSRNPVPFDAVHFSDLSAQGEVRDLERFRPGLNTFFTSGPNFVASTAQLMRSGFAVH